jgi:hypothetical protein
VVALVRRDHAPFSLLSGSGFPLCYGTLGNCHLEGSDLPFESQPETARVSFGKQRWVTSRER